MVSGILALPIVWVGLDLVRYRLIQAYTVDLGPIAAFVPQYSYSAGDPLPLRVHAEGPVEGAVYRLGATKDLVASDIEIGWAEQARRFDLLEGFEWEVTHTLDTASLDSGLHVVELFSVEDPTKRFMVPFVITTVVPDIAVFLSTNTWEAYNDYGGISNYENDHFSRLTSRLVAEVVYWGGQSPDVRLAWSKPNVATSEDLIGETAPASDFHSRLVRQEWAFIAFLESSGLEYGIYTDRDLAFTDAWKAADLIVFPGHAEYWSDEMFHAFDQYLASGGHALISAGNPMLKPVRFHEGFTAFQQTEVPSDRIRDLIGASFTRAGIFTAAAYQVEEPEHWVFSGLDLEVGDRFGQHSITRPVPGSGGTDSPDGASGFFTLEPGYGSSGFIELAVGLNDDGPAHMMFGETDAGGWVFNSGSGSFTGALFDDPVVIGIVHNLIEDALGG